MQRGWQSSLIIESVLDGRLDFMWLDYFSLKIKML